MSMATSSTTCSECGFSHGTHTPVCTVEALRRLVQLCADNKLMDTTTMSSWPSRWLQDGLEHSLELIHEEMRRRKETN